VKIRDAFEAKAALRIIRLRIKLSKLLTHSPTVSLFSSPYLSLADRGRRLVLLAVVRAALRVLPNEKVVFVLRGPYPKGRANAYVHVQLNDARRSPLGLRSPLAGDVAAGRGGLGRVRRGGVVVLRRSCSREGGKKRA